MGRVRLRKSAGENCEDGDGLFNVFKTLAGDGFQTLQTGEGAAAPQAGGAEKIYLSVFSLRYEKAHEKKAKAAGR